MAGLAMKKIVVPFDFSDESKAAIDRALEIAESAGDVHVMHVLPPLNVAEPGVIWQTVDDSSRKRHALMALEEQLGDEVYQGLQLHVNVGDAGDHIAEYADDIQAELIVMPSHGRRGIKRLLMGSVAERVLRLAHCPVLVLKVAVSG